MNTELAEIYRTRLTGLPFLDRAVGLVRTLEQAAKNGDESRTLRLPVPVSFTAEDCENDARYLVPDQDTASILFFEDGGVVPFTVTQGFTTWQSTLTLKLWLNPTQLLGTISEAALINALEKQLQLKQRTATGPYVDLLASYAVLPGGPGIFSGYSFETPLLYPPFQMLALEIKTQFRLAAPCLTAPLPTRRTGKYDVCAP